MVNKPKTTAKRRGRPRTGQAMSAAERMRRMRERRKTAGLYPVTSWVPREEKVRPTYSSHRLLEARSLAMHAVIARKIDRDPSLLEIPNRNLERWADRKTGTTPPWLQEWRNILARPWSEIAALITEPSENSARLRQSTPFAGVLSTAERNRIYDAFRT